MRSIATAGLLLGLVAGCSAGTFACFDDGDCSGPEGGRCEPGGSCSFPDPECASGRRYGELSSPEHAGTCVALDDATTSGPDVVTTTISTTTTVTTTTATTSASVTTEDADTTGPPPDLGSTPVTTGDACPADWWSCDFRYRVRLSLDAQPTVLADVTIPLLLAGDRIDYASALPDGADVRIIDDGGTPLGFEIERWDPTATSVLWVRVPTLGAAPLDLWLYYGNADATAASDPAAAWSDVHAGVWHMDGAAIDSTGNTAAGVASGGVTDAEGRLGRALEFGAIDDRVDVAPADAITDVFASGGTVSAWANADSFGGTQRGRIADNSEGTDPGWMFYISGDNGGEVGWRLGFPTGQVIWRSPGGTIELGTWYHVAAVFDATVDTEPQLYIDGVAQPVSLTSGVALGEPPSDVGHVLTIGNSDVPLRWFDGRIDELRLERVARDGDWLALQRAAMTDALVGYGAIESLPDG